MCLFKMSHQRKTGPTSKYQLFTKDYYSWLLNMVNAVSIKIKNKYDWEGKKLRMIKRQTGWINHHGGKSGSDRKYQISNQMIMAWGRWEREEERERQASSISTRHWGAAVAKEMGHQAQVANHNTESVDPDGRGEKRRREGRVMWWWGIMVTMTCHCHREHWNINRFVCVWDTLISAITKIHTALPPSPHSTNKTRRSEDGRTAARLHFAVNPAF